MILIFPAFGLHVFVAGRTRKNMIANKVRFGRNDVLPFFRQFFLALRIPLCLRQFDESTTSAFSILLLSAIFGPLAFMNLSAIGRRLHEKNI